MVEINDDWLACGLFERIFTCFLDGLRRVVAIIGHMFVAYRLFWFGGNLRSRFIAYLVLA